MKHLLTTGIRGTAALLTCMLIYTNEAAADPCANNVCPSTPTPPPPCTDQCCPPGSPSPPGHPGSPSGPPSPPGHPGAPGAPSGPPSPSKGKADGGSGGCSNCSDARGPGMATWLVSEPWVTLQIEDLPISYSPARGPRIDFRLTYRQDQPVKEFTNIFGLGTNWSCTFREYVYPDPGNSSVAYLHKVGASWVLYNIGIAQIRDGSILTTLGGGGYQIEHRDGSVDKFSTVATNSDGDVYYFLTTRADPAGNANTYTYSTNSGIFRLDTVIDPDGNTNHVYYENTSFPAQITKVVDPYLRTNLLYYDSQGYLTNSIDPMGLSSSFAYDSGANRGWITNMTTTTYGTTSFSFGALTEDPNDVFVLVTLPTGGKHLYLYRYSSGFLSSVIQT